MQKLKLLIILLFISVQAVFAQTKTIKGTVVDSEGLPLPGVTVVVVGTTTGTVTSIDGNFTIDVEPANELRFSFIGFAEQVITVGEQTVINVTLAADTEELEEVVVVGYGTQKKESVVGAITQTKGEDLKKQGNVSNLSDALAGAMPGVSVMTGTGLPGGGGNLTGNNYEETEILIRGKATWNNSSPLVLVDGIERNMDDIDVNEVENISVLKDASATAVYGVKGGNGVILITTKRGSVSKPKFTFEANTTWENISKIAQVEDAYTGILSRNRAIINEAAVNPDSWNDYVPDEILGYYRDNTYPYAYPSLDLTETMLKDYGRSHRFNMNVAGGTNFVKYFGSLSYNHVGDIMATEDVGQGYNPEYSYDRFNFRSNLDFAITKTTDLSVNLSGFYGAQQTSGANYHTVWYGLYNHAPDWPVTVYEDGIYGNSEGTYERVGENELAGLLFQGYNKFNNTEINTDFKLNQKLDFITKGLSAAGKFAYDNSFVTAGENISDDGVLTKTIDPEFYTSGGYWDEASQSYKHPDGLDVEDFTTYYYPEGYNASSGFNWKENPLGYTPENVQIGNTNYLNRTRRNLYYEVGLNYNRTYGKHEVTGLALFSRQRTEIGSNWAQLREDWVGRATYYFNRKYLLELNGSYNGSEKFGPGYKFDFFPSVAVGWTVSNERFFKENLEFVNLFKIRYSDGVVGNDRLSGIQWGYATIWDDGSMWSGSTQAQERFGDEFLVQGPLKYNEGTPGNPDLQWETAHKRNLGFEWGAFKNVFTGSLDVFWEDRDNMLVAANQRNIPETFGQTAPAANIGAVKSNGMEVEASIRKSYRNSFSFYVSGNWTIAKNEILEKEDPELKPDYQKQEGYAIGQNRSTLESEIMQSWDDVYTGVLDYSNNSDVLPGDFRFVDFNSNGEIDPNDGVPYGYPIYPQNTYGFSGGLSYKGFSLNVQFYGVYNVTKNIRLDRYSFDSPTIYEVLLEDTWTPEYGNANPTYPHLTYKKQNNGTGAYNLWDASYLRLKTAELSYSLPSRWLDPIGLSQLRVFVNGNNLFVWTDMPTDGEGANFDIKNYPVKKQMTLGLNLQF